MKSYVKYIGLVDKSDGIHFVEFTSGVNIITGKSSTGKSAMIEIFDYCFGNSMFTIPSGIITKNAELYFLVLSIEKTFIVIGREKGKNKVFLKEETSLPEINEFKKEYFKKAYWSNNFNVDLGHYFGLNIDDTDEDLEDRKHRKYNAKKGRPSIRNITPFLLQHQNLIANKHSIFYRFDQKEKREQTIEQFKIFAGFVTQEYFTTKQLISEKLRELAKLENRQNEEDRIISSNKDKLEEFLSEYFVVSGCKLFEESSDLILLNPKNYLDRLASIQNIANYANDEMSKQINNIQTKIDKLFLTRRGLNIKLSNIISSIEYGKNFNENLDDTLHLNNSKIFLSKCPFCNSENEQILGYSNKLENAFSWLNSELQKSTYLVDSFEVDKKAITTEIQFITDEIEKLKKAKEKLNNIYDNISNKSLDKQAEKIQVKIELLLEYLMDNDKINLDDAIANIKKDISRLNGIIELKFSDTNKINNAEKYICTQMNEIGKHFDFEDSYQPINLKFSLESFDLWHQAEDEKIFLRSMGSGANWLYSHLSLFLALNKFFCSLGKKALVPPILFFDQPSQVYFPTSIKDDEDTFNAKFLKRREGKINNSDDDLKSVTNFFNQLVKYCKSTLEETGIEPQIIITDHADNLKLDTIEFETLVNGRRWRKRGFIQFEDNV